MGLKIENVKKSFIDKIAVDNISFEMNKPGIFGLLGTNGAGKTTTIRMILGIQKKDSGKITWNDKPVERKNVKFGYLPEERGVYPKILIKEQLVYFAKLKGMTKKDAEDSLKYWAGRLKVEEYMNMAAEKLSKGNQQKIQFIAAVIHNPELIVLDEPFSGLDPVNTELLKNIILELKENGKYIIMSSHQMVSIEEFCTDVVILNKGKTVLKGNLEEIKNSYKATKVEVFTMSEIKEYINRNNLVIEKNIGNEYLIKIDNEEQGRNLLRELIKNNIEVNKFELKKPSLHDIFIEKVGE